MSLGWPQEDLHILLSKPQRPSPLSALSMSLVFTSGNAGGLASWGTAWAQKHTLVHQCLHSDRRKALVTQDGWVKSMEGQQEAEEEQSSTDL